MSILHTAGVRLCAGFLRYCSFSWVHLEVCSPQSHNHWFDLSMTSYHPWVQRTLFPSDSFSTAPFECFRGYVVFWFQRHPKTLIWVFACLFFGHFTEHLLVAASHRKQLQSFLFHNYCDHPCRMAQLEEQLGRINQSCESRAGGTRYSERNHTVSSTADWGFFFCFFLLCRVVHRCGHQSEPRGCEMCESGDLSGSG